MVLMIKAVSKSIIIIIFHHYHYNHYRNHNGNFENNVNIREFNNNDYDLYIHTYICIYMYTGEENTIHKINLLETKRSFLGLWTVPISSSGQN